MQSRLFVSVVMHSSFMNYNLKNMKGTLEDSVIFEWRTKVTEGRETRNSFGNGD